MRKNKQKLYDELAKLREERAQKDATAGNMPADIAVEDKENDRFDTDPNAKEKK